VLDDGTVADVDCGVTFPYVLVSGDTLVGTYEATGLDGDEATNTVDVGTSGDVGGDSGSAAIDWDNPDITKVDDCIDVTDDQHGDLGTVCADQLDQNGQYTCQYIIDVGATGTCGEFTNTASFTTNTTGATGSSSWPVNVICAGQNGCTYTIGYWKTHAGFTGNNADVVTQFLPILLGAAGGAKTQSVDTAAEAVQFLSFYGSNNVLDASNGINKLYAQLLVAKLAIANGADGSAVAATIAAADAFLANKNSTNWSSLSKAQKNTVLGWVTTLDNFNNGVIGPGHCDEPITI